MKTNLKMLMLITCCFLMLSGCTQPDKSEQVATETTTADNSSLNETTSNGESQYIGQWEADQYKGKLTINTDGTFRIEYYEPSSVGEGTWECTPESITLSKTTGDIYFISSGESVKFDYYDIFAPVLSLQGPDGSVILSFSHHK